MCHGTLTPGDKGRAPSAFGAFNTDLAVSIYACMKPHLARTWIIDIGADFLTHPFALPSWNTVPILMSSLSRARLLSRSLALSLSVSRAYTHAHTQTYTMYTYSSTHTRKRRGQQ